MKVKHVGKFMKDCLEALREKVSSSEDLREVLGYGLLYKVQQEKEELVWETVLSVLLTVAEKQGVRKTFTTLLKGNVCDKYVNALRVPDWSQLYVQFTTKLPIRTWQPFWIFLTSTKKDRSNLTHVIYL